MDPITNASSHTTPQPVHPLCGLLAGKPLRTRARNGQRCWQHHQHACRSRNRLCRALDRRPWVPFQGAGAQRQMAQGQRLRARFGMGLWAAHEQDSAPHRQFGFSNIAVSAQQTQRRCVQSGSGRRAAHASATRELDQGAPRTRSDWLGDQEPSLGMVMMAAVTGSNMNHLELPAHRRVARQ